MNLILESEYLQIIFSLPINKTSGFSSVTYEAVKHAGPICHSLIIKLLNVYIHITLIPNSW